MIEFSLKVAPKQIRETAPPLEVNKICVFDISYQYDDVVPLGKVRFRSESMGSGVLIDCFNDLRVTVSLSYLCSRVSILRDRMGHKNGFTISIVDIVSGMVCEVKLLCVRLLPCSEHECRCLDASAGPSRSRCGQALWPRSALCCDS